MVAVVVPSPATSEVLEATSRTSWAPIFSYGSSSSISFATVTPSLVIVGLPNFLSRMTLRPLGPSVAFTAFANFSIPRSKVCRALSSNCSCLAAISFLLLRLSDDAEDVVLAHDQVILIVDFNFGAAVFRDQHLVALFYREIDFLAVFIDFARAKSNDLPLLWFFLGGIGDDDPALFHFLLFERLHQHPISERSYVNCCHRFFFTPFGLFGLSRRLSILATAADRLLLFFLVFVHDFEFGVDDVALAPLSGAGAFFSTRRLLRFRARLRPRSRASLC